MTLNCADSITVPNLPTTGYQAYLGYVNGTWPTYFQLKQQFSRFHTIGLTVFAGNIVADGCDRETGDLDPAQAASWVKWRLDNRAWRPILYASVSNMGTCISELHGLGVARAQARLLSAHYGDGRHICGPSTCNYYPGMPDFDGTQWTDSAPGRNGSAIDASDLQDTFFNGVPTPTPNWQETMMSQLLTLKQGSSGPQVSTVQGCCIARGQGHLLGTSGPNHDGVDGSFGPATKLAVEAVQRNARIGVDGIVSSATWPILVEG